MRTAGITHGAFHRLRHTTATHLIRNGASPSQAQLWLGHHDPGFTARTYVHLEASDLPNPTVFDALLKQPASRMPATADLDTEVSPALAAGEAGA
jgi:integrase